MIPEGIDGIARIGLLFLDGDDFEEVLIDQEAHTDYRFAPFNRLRSCLSKIEVLDPQLDVSAILWRFIPGNSYVAEPIIAGNALPQTGWRRIYAGPMLLVLLWVPQQRSGHCRRAGIARGARLSQGRR